MTTHSVTDSGFESDVLGSSEPTLVDFWAEWCGPCKQIAPSLEEIAETMSGRVKIVKMNIDDNPETPTRYGVRAIPTLMLFREGQAAAVMTGAKSKSAIAAWIERALQ